MTNPGYQGKCVVVTGAASGMGAATAKKLVEAGAKVIGADIADIKTPGVEGFKIDLTDSASIDQFVNTLADESVDALFHCAGLPQTFAASKVLTVNFVGARYFLESMFPKIASGGAAVAIASLVIAWPQHVQNLMPLVNTQSFDEGAAWAEANAESPLLAVTQNDPYMFSKEALACWCTMAAPRWIQRGVRLNVLGPGKTSTPMMSHFEEAVGEAMAQLPVPIGRNSTPEEQASVMLFMNDPACSYLVGSTVYADGGSGAALMTMFASGLIGDLL